VETPSNPEPTYASKTRAKLRRKDKTTEMKTTNSPLPTQSVEWIMVPNRKEKTKNKHDAYQQMPNQTEAQTAANRTRSQSHFAATCQATHEIANLLNDNKPIPKNPNTPLITTQPHNKTPHKHGSRPPTKQSTQT
jgi:hypothetical protein